MIQVRQLQSTEIDQNISALAEVLHDCVEGGASVSFMPPFSLEDAKSFFESVATAVHRGERILLAAFLDNQLVGTVQIITATPPNQPHRADIAKLLVKRSARGQGIAALLMEAVESASKQAGKTLLVLDTATSDTAERLYTRLGWTRVGTIPNYALYPNGAPCDTTIFWKSLAK